DSFREEPEGPQNRSKNETHSGFFFASFSWAAAAQNRRQPSRLWLLWIAPQLLITDADSVVHKNRFVVVFTKVGGQWKLQVDSGNPPS
ncbi:MAG TPA: hypothetical protein PKM58_09035, partial [Pyrinomonadaceae bacterium]|nr:hypothetical protein [Pyrinomonadaceae bacterium]